MQQISTFNVDTAGERATALYGFIDRHRALIDVHSVDFFVCDHWHKVFPQEWTRSLDLENLPRDEALILPKKCINDSNNNFLPSFYHFLVEASELRLPGLYCIGDGTCDDCCHSNDNNCHGDIGHSDDLHGNKADMFGTFGMTKKKSHEVEKMSRQIAQVMTKNQLRQILDLGSGKGYLSEHLALRYNFSVVGVDSQQLNTEGANRRNRKVYKVWKRVNAPAEPSTLPLSATETDEVLSTEEENIVQHDHLLEEDSRTIKEHQSEGLPEEDSRTIKEHQSEGLPEEDSRTIREHQSEGLSEKDSRTIKEHQSEGLLEEDSRTIKEHQSQLEGLSETRQEVSHLQLQEDVKKSSFVPMTMELRPETVHNFMLAAESASEGKFDSQLPFCLVGLHVCGDLGCTALRIFTEVPQARALCIVGCCYHHISEVEGESEDNLAGFPMSSLLRGVGAHIGRNGRMLACQSLTRLSETASGSSLDRLYWRALLQVVFARKYSHLYQERSGEITVGRFRHSPDNFVSYAQAAFKKVGVSDSEVFDEELLKIDGEFSSQRKYLGMFLKIRTLLAPCIESLIILDRLLYLQEKVANAGTVHLNMLFDPTVSPRCAGIFAEKHV